MLLILQHRITLAGVDSKFKTLIRNGLLLSLMRDTALMFVFLYSNLFLVRLIFFLIAHLFYISAFIYNIRQRGNIGLSKESKSLMPTLLISLVCFSGFYSIVFIYLKSGLEDFFIPVSVFLIVLFGMGFFSSLRHSSTTRFSYLIILFGALIFISSDLSITLEKFKGVDSVWMGPFIMSTYYLAQYMITAGNY